MNIIKPLLFLVPAGVATFYGYRQFMRMKERHLYRIDEHAFWMLTEFEHKFSYLRGRVAEADALEQDLKGIREELTQTAPSSPRVVGLIAWMGHLHKKHFPTHAPLE